MAAKQVGGDGRGGSKGSGPKSGGRKSVSFKSGGPKSGSPRSGGSKTGSGSSRTGSGSSRTGSGPKTGSLKTEIKKWEFGTGSTGSPKTGSSTGHGAGKSRLGPRQPAARKEGNAGVARKPGPRDVRRPPLPKRDDRRVERVAPTYAPPVQAVDEYTPLDRVSGLHPVIELLQAGSRSLDTVYVDVEKGGKIIGDIIKLTRSMGVTLKMVPKGALDKLSDGIRHQGVVATVSPIEFADADWLADEAMASSKTPLLVLLDGVEDPRNLGSIIRSAEAAGTFGVIIPDRRSATPNATVAKASAGAVEHMPIAKVKNLATYIGTLKDKGYWVAGVEADAGTPYTSCDMAGPLALVLGGEGKGLRKAVSDACDVVISLPMLGRVSSLNVSVAAGITLYEALRQRGK